MSKLGGWSAMAGHAEDVPGQSTGVGTAVGTAAFTHSGGRRCQSQYGEVGARGSTPKTPSRAALVAHRHSIQSAPHQAGEADAGAHLRKRKGLARELSARAHSALGFQVGRPNGRRRMQEGQACRTALVKAGQGGKAKRQ